MTADEQKRKRRYETLRSLYGVTSLDRERLAELKELAKEFDPSLHARLSAG